MGIRKILLLHPGDKPDYLNDMLFIALLTDSNIALDSNIYPSYLFDDYKTSNLYGKGFTLYKMLEVSFRKKALDFNTIRKRIINKYYAKVIYSSIRRFSRNFEFINKYYYDENLICIDGEDDLNISIKHATSAIYFKRELSKILYKNNIKPISFFIPNLILSKIRKKYDLTSNKIYFKAYCDPNDRSTYIFDNQKEYYSQYSNSLFGITKKKGGWDCLRHYEIILCNCLPYFQKIEKKPTMTMQEYPVNLQIIANEIYNKKFNSRIDQFDFKLYRKIQNGFSEYINEISKNFGSRELKELIYKQEITLKRKKVKIFRKLLNTLYLKFINCLLAIKWSLRQSIEYGDKSLIKITYYFFSLLITRIRN